MRAAIQEDAHGIARQLLPGRAQRVLPLHGRPAARARRRPHPGLRRRRRHDHCRTRSSELEAYGVERIYTPEDGRRLGLDGMIDDVIARDVRPRASAPRTACGRSAPRDHAGRSRRAITAARGRGRRRGEATLRAPAQRAAQTRAARPVSASPAPAARASRALTDELLRRFLRPVPGHARSPCVAVDPTRRRSRRRAARRPHPHELARARRRSSCARWPRARQHLATSAVLADVHRAAARPPASTCRRRDRRHRPERRRDRRPRRRLAVRHDAASTARASQLEKIDMLDFADIVVLNKFEKRGAEDALRDVRKQWRRNRDAFDSCRTTSCRCFRPSPASSTTPASTALFQRCARAARRASGLATGRWTLPRRRRRSPSTDRATRSCRRSACATSPRSPRRAGARASTIDAAARRRRARAGLYASLAGARRRGAAGAARPLRRRAPTDASEPALALRAAYNRALDDVGAEAVALLRDWPAREQASRDEQYRYTRARPRDPRRRTTRESLSHNTIPKVALPSYDDWGELAALPAAARTCRAASRTPRASIRIGARTRTRPACSRARARPSAPTAASTTSRAGTPATRLSTAFDSVTLYGEDPRRAPRHLRQGRQLRRVDRHPRRHEEAVLRLRPVRAHDVGVDDDQRPGADDPRVLHEHRHRPAGRALPARHGAGTTSSAIASCGTRAPAYRGELPEATTASGSAARRDRRPGARRRDLRADPRRDAARVRGTVQADILKEDQAPEHLHLLHRVRAADDGRHPGVVHRATRCATSTRCRSPATTSPRPGRTRSRQLAFTLANGFTYRRVLPRARHGHRRLRAEPVVLLLQRHGPRVRGDRPRRAPHLGASRCASATAPTSAARS